MEFVVEIFYGVINTFVENIFGNITKLLSIFNGIIGTLMGLSEFLGSGVKLSVFFMKLSDLVIE